METTVIAVANGGIVLQAGQQRSFHVLPEVLAVMREQDPHVPPSFAISPSECSQAVPFVPSFGDYYDPASGLYCHPAEAQPYTELYKWANGELARRDAEAYQRMFGELYGFARRFPGA